MFPNSHYPLLTKFDIASFFKDIESMKKSTDDLDKFNTTISKRIYRKQQAYFIAISTKNSTKAKQLIHDDLKNYPEEAKESILNNLDYLAKHYK